MALDLPAPDTTRLVRSPLELVVCQVRHERRISVDGPTALAVHEELGGALGPYPVLDEATGTELNLLVGPGVQNVRETRSSGWRFTSSDGAWVVTLMPDHFALETTAYTSWAEEFFPRLEQLVRAAEQHIRPTFEQRIGLRYVDRISELALSSLADWKPYLEPHALALVTHPALGFRVRNLQQHAILDLDDGVIAGVRHGPVIDQAGGIVDYQLDFDVFRQGSRAFEADSILAISAEFNTYALQLFQATVTDELLERLR